MAHHFVDMHPARQVWEGAGGAIVSGVICGLLGTTTWWAYLISLVVTVVGGLGAGAQHRTNRGALIRGLVAGALWGAALWIAVEITGRDAVALIPEPVWTMILYSIVVTMITTPLTRVIALAIARRRSGSAATA